MSTNFKRPKVTVNCVADNYSNGNERIVEFSFPDGSGGLIRLIEYDDGDNVIEIYNHDGNVRVKEGLRLNQ